MESLVSAITEYIYNNGTFYELEVIKDETQYLMDTEKKLLNLFLANMYDKDYLNQEKIKDVLVQMNRDALAEITHY